ncbi:hypothetical protein B005_5201 [Nocardiopsis alba ATCC BAA-2165]|uniref:Uncharacterized protein n=1 Tax=Nocardiopsis alba (strain ATCC BAA-2165 / BE74) TaxID=1205910 RepID=J7LDT0_NOCAA|nr:hypothetical protein B005_5201 [Nocardiopsis alba ATCC BAA-2165]
MNHRRGNAAPETPGGPVCRAPGNGPRRAGTTSEGNTMIGTIGFVLMIISLSMMIISGLIATVVKTR